MAKGRTRGPVPGTPQARNGGLAIKEKYGQDFYREIGAKGGKVVKEGRGSAFYAEIGRKGGQTTKERHGAAHFSAIGKVGGASAGRPYREGRAEPA